MGYDVIGCGIPRQPRKERRMHIENTNQFVVGILSSIVGLLQTSLAVYSRPSNALVQAATFSSLRSKVLSGLFWVVVGAAMTLHALGLGGGYYAIELSLAWALIVLWSRTHDSKRK